MSIYSRYAIYYMPRPGKLADFGAAWLGWDALKGEATPQIDVEKIAALTDTPRKYGFHGTLKPPFRLAQGATSERLQTAVQDLADRTAPGQADGLALTALGRFFALTPVGDVADLARVASACVTELDSFRAPASDTELARRRKANLSDRQNALLEQWGYPYVLDQFRFHLTLTGRLDKADLEPTEKTISQHLPALPRPFMLEDICLCGERADGKFELIQRFILSG